MRRSFADAILKAYRETARPNIPAEATPTMRVPLLVDFELDDLQWLDRSMTELDTMLPPTDKA